MLARRLVDASIAWKRMPRPSLKSLVIVALLVLIALWLHWPSLGAGLAADDYLNRAMLDGEYPVARSPLDLYSFLRRPGELAPLQDGGIAPWWSHPDLKLSLLRPLASLLLWLDHSVLGLSARAQHVHSLLWLAALIIAYFVFVRRVVAEGAALIATAVLAFDSALVAPIAWICNRTALISATFGALGLWAYLRHREDGWRPGAKLALVFFTLALAGGEYAICALAYVLSYELAATREPLGIRLRGLALAVVPAALYLSVHIALGYGANGSVVYIGPFQSPKQFLSEATLRIPAMIATELLLVPGEQFYGKLIARSPELWTSLIPLTLVVVLMAGTWRRAEPRARCLLTMCALGALFGMLPLTGTIPSVRLLLIASFGGSALIGATIWDSAALVAHADSRGRALTWLRAAATLPVLVVHLGFSARFTHDHTILWKNIVGGIRAKHLAAEIDDDLVATEELFLINAGGEIASMIYPPWVRHARGAPLPRRWRVLTIANAEQHLVRVSDDTLEMEVTRGHMFEDPTSQMFREPSLVFHPGDKATLPGLEVTVLSVDGWAPKKVRFKFETNLDDPKRVFLLLENGRMRRALMPEVGGDFVVPPFG